VCLQLDDVCAAEDDGAWGQRRARAWQQQQRRRQQF
jgi:hypothetical protein